MLFRQAFWSPRYQEHGLEVKHGPKLGIAATWPVCSLPLATGAAEEGRSWGCQSVQPKGAFCLKLLLRQNRIILILKFIHKTETSQSIKSQAEMIKPSFVESWMDSFVRITLICEKPLVFSLLWHLALHSGMFLIMSTIFWGHLWRKSTHSPSRLHSSTNYFLQLQF